MQEMRVRGLCAENEGQGAVCRRGILAVSLGSVNGWRAYVVKTELCHRPNL